MVSSGKLEFVYGEVGAASAPPLWPDIPDNTMTWTPTATRADVVRMVARYVRLEFSIRSGAGRLAIDESRVTKRRRGEDQIDIMSMSLTEIREASRNWQIRQAVTARPEVQQHTSSDPRMLGTPIRRVAPLRDVARVVKLKSRTAGGAAPQASAREWRATVGQKISRAGAQVLIEVEQIRLSLKETRNQLAAARTAQGRLRGGAKPRKKVVIRGNVDAIVSTLAAREEADSSRLRALVKTRGYVNGVDALLHVCTKTPEIESYCFGEMN